jgi:quercetin dioxygenase-like cupin family protein
MGATQAVRAAGEGRAVWLLGGRYTVKVSGEESGGEATVMEMWMHAGSGPPPHNHPGGEALYVLEGTLEHHLGDKVIPAGPGDFFFIPAGTDEFFVATSELKVLITYTPGGIDQFFLEVGETPTNDGLPAPMQGPPPPEFIERLVSTAARYGMNILA